MALSTRLLFLLSMVSPSFSLPSSSLPSRYYLDAVNKNSSLNVLKTTVTPSGMTIDWIPIESQGEIASPPPALDLSFDGLGPKPLSELQLPGAELGPAGTVPVPRMSHSYLANAGSSKGSPISTKHAKRQYSGDHWYVNSDQSVDNVGGSAIFSMFDAYVQNNNDFSLLQTALTMGDQTLEGGWINYPAQVSQPHLFTYYTTDGYKETGDYIGGWNTDVKGWVQVDNTVHPGSVFETSTIGGSQYEMFLQYELYQGNWWLNIAGTWIGYYPASIYSNNQPDASQTLAASASGVFYYGEIFQTEGPYTTTDMGSGNFADAGYGSAGYIHNMTYLTGSDYTSNDYSAGFVDSDSSRYTHATGSTPSDWGSYTYLGGPGAGGVVGG